MVVIVLTILTNGAVFFPGLQGTPLQTVLGLAFVTVIPGYALVSALFPESDQSVFPTGNNSEHDEVATDRWDISGVERVAFALGLSAAVVPLIGLVLNFTPWGIRLVPIMIVLDVFVLSTVAVSIRRRLALPPEERFQVWLFPYFSLIRRVRRPETRSGALLNLTLLAVLLVAAGSVGFALATPSPADATTGFYLLTENDDGELVAADYPEKLTVDNASTPTVGIDNEEFERLDYTVIVQLQRVERVDNGVRVLDRWELDRFERSLAHNETWRKSHEIVPPIAGDDLRLQYLLYRSEPPEDPTVETAYRTLHLWVNVERSNRTDVRPATRSGGEEDLSLRVRAS